MEPHWHCELCEHQDVSLKEGNICGLTGKKPGFTTTCNKIEFGDRRDEKIVDINAKYQKVLKNYLKHFFLMAYAVPIFIAAIGITLLGMGWGALNNYRNNLSIAKANKNEIDLVLSAYNIDYKLKLDFLKSFHGEPKVKSDLQFYYKE